MIAGVNAYYSAADADIDKVVIRTPLENKIPGIEPGGEVQVKPLPSPTDIYNITGNGLVTKMEEWGPSWFIRIKIKIRSFPSKSENMANILHLSTGKSAITGCPRKKGE